VTSNEGWSLACAEQVRGLPAGFVNRPQGTVQILVCILRPTGESTGAIDAGLLETAKRHADSAGSGRAAEGGNWVCQGGRTVIEELGQHVAKPSVKQHLAALRMLFDYLVTGRCCQDGGTIQHAQ